MYLKNYSFECEVVMNSLNEAALGAKKQTDRQADTMAKQQTSMDIS